jgi:HEPN domain-containing protein
VDERERHRHEVMPWVRKADEDVAVVRAVIAAEPPLLGGAAYHCQQAAEKLLKAALVLERQPVPKIHDLAELGRRVLAARASWADLVAPLTVLTEWGAVYRYPVLDSSLAEPEPSREEIEAVLDEIAALRAAVTALTG